MSFHIFLYTFCGLDLFISFILLIESEDTPYKNVFNIWHFIVNFITSAFCILVSFSSIKLSCYLYFILILIIYITSYKKYKKLK